jgi:hypothetical protein
MHWWVIFSALEDAEVGKDMQDRLYEGKAAGSRPDRNSKIALALARGGRPAEAGRLADQISKENPGDTLVQHYFIPPSKPRSSCGNTIRRQPSICSAALPSTIWR